MASVVCLSLLLVSVPVGAEALEVGAAAPPIELSGLLQAPSGAAVDWQSLRGKVVILEFWATWCGPCVHAIPHLNDLAVQFHDQPLVFISVTDEDRPTVEEFLQKQPIEGWIGIGASKRTMAAYGVDAIPRSVVVDPDGHVLGVTSWNQLSHEKLAALLRGESVSFLKKDGFTGGDLPSSIEVERPLFRVQIQETVLAAGSPAIGSGAMNRYGLTTIGVTLERLIRDALEVTPAEIEMHVRDSEQLYDVIINRPESNRKAMSTLLREALENAFGLKFEPTEREIETYVLRCVDGVEPRLKKSDLGSLTISGRRDGYRFTTADMKNVALNLANTLKRPVIDETGIDYTFNAELTFDPDNPDSLRTAVRDSMGLVLAPERRMRTVWVVRAPENE